MSFHAVLRGNHEERADTMMPYVIPRVRREMEESDRKQEAQIEEIKGKAAPTS